MEESPCTSTRRCAHGVAHLRRRREAVGHAHDEVAGGGRTPADDHRGNDTERQAVGADHRAQGGERQRADHDAVHWRAQVRQPGQGHRGGDGELEDGEARVEPGEVRGQAGAPRRGRGWHRGEGRRPAATPATAICRTAARRGTSRPMSTSATITPIDPTNQSAVISQWMPVGGGVMSSVRWISNEVLACARGTQITTSTVATPTRRRPRPGAAWCRRRAARAAGSAPVAPGCGPRRRNGLNLGVGGVPVAPMTFMPDGGCPARALGRATGGCICRNLVRSGPPGQGRGLKTLNTIDLVGFMPSTLSPMRSPARWHPTREPGTGSSPWRPPEWIPARWRAASGRPCTGRGRSTWRRTWRLVAQTPDFDAWLIAWPSGGKIDLHDHGNSTGALSVISGRSSRRCHGGTTPAALTGPPRAAGGATSASAPGTSTT